MPGYQLRLEAELTRELRGVGKYTVCARVEGNVVAEAELMCAYRTLEKKEP